MSTTSSSSPVEQSKGLHLHGSGIDDASEIACGIAEMQQHMPLTLYQLYTDHWLTSTQYHTSIQLVSAGSISMLSAYVNYLYDRSVSKLVERVLRRVLYSISQITLPPFTDSNTSTYLNAHIEHMYRAQQLSHLEYQYLLAQLHQSNVVLEAALACVASDGDAAGGVAELHDTLKRLSQQYVRHGEYIQSVYAELRPAATAYIQWYYQRCLQYKTGISTEQMHQVIASADCMYLLGLLPYTDTDDNACDVLYAAMDAYIMQEQTLDNSDDTVYQKQLAVLQDELDDTLYRLSQKWRLDCDLEQQSALQSLHRLVTNGALLRGEMEQLEELVYTAQHDAVTVLATSAAAISHDRVYDTVDTVLQPHYTAAITHIHSVLQWYNTNTAARNHDAQHLAHLPPLTLAGSEYIQSLINAHDPALLAIGSLAADSTQYAEAYDSIARLSNRWRVIAQPNQQQLLVLLNNLIEFRHIPGSMGETIELCVYRNNAKLMAEFDRFTAAHNATRDTAVLDRNWESMWNVLCVVLAKHHKGVETLQ